MAQTAIITGASGGIARATATLLASKGYNLSLLSRNVASNQEFIKLLPKGMFLSNEQHFMALKCDISDIGCVKDCVSETQEKLGSIQSLVNTAGINKDGLFIKYSPEMMLNLFQTNVIGTMYITQQVLPYMIKQKQGSIVSIGSIVGEDGNFGQAVYSATKAALIGFTKSLSKEVARYNIRANLIEPGFVDTNMTKDIPEKIKSNVLSQIPLRLFGQPKQIASLIYYLLSDDSSYMTGSIIRADGGLHL
ncbi:hypothetical protein WA158_002514 [Blastocystis sp. Blastoise]